MRAKVAKALRRVAEQVTRGMPKRDLVVKGMQDTAYNPPFMWFKPYQAVNQTHSTRAVYLALKRQYKSKGKAYA